MYVRVCVRAQISHLIQALLGGLLGLVRDIGVLEGPVVRACLDVSRQKGGLRVGRVMWRGGKLTP